jgi:hypothetical protein
MKRDNFAIGPCVPAIILRAYDNFKPDRAAPAIEAAARLAAGLIAGIAAFRQVIDTD